MTPIGALNGIALILALVSCGAGLRAALLWGRASRVPVDPEWKNQFQPVDPIQANGGWTNGLMRAFGVSGTLNASAAHWSAIAVSTAGMQSLISSIAGYLTP